MCGPCGLPFGTPVETTLKNGKLKLADDQPGHKLRAVFDDAKDRGSALLTYKEGRNKLTIKIKDTSLADDNCSCTP